MPMKTLRKLSYYEPFKSQLIEKANLLKSILTKMPNTSYEDSKKYYELESSINLIDLAIETTELNKARAKLKQSSFIMREVANYLDLIRFEIDIKGFQLKDEIDILIRKPQLNLNQNLIAEKEPVNITSNQTVFEKNKETIVMNAHRTIKIFLASSNELEDERRDFEIFINRKNKELNKEQIFLELNIWEDFIDAMSLTRLQDEYNIAVKECDIFIMLFYTKVGAYTNEEFERAFGQFKENSKPIIYTYFKESDVNISHLNRKDFNSMLDFKDKLKELDHFVTVFKNKEDLKLQFTNQLEKLFKAGRI